MKPFRWTLAILALVGCTEGLDVYSEVEDLRVLGIQAEPPEVFFEDVLPPDDPVYPTLVTFRVLLVDPRGEPVRGADVVVASGGNNRSSTGADGRFSIQRCPTGNRQLIILTSWVFTH